MMMLAGRAYVLHAVLMVLFVLALRRGGAPERILATTLLVALAVDRFYHLITGSHPVMMLGVDFGHFAIDAVELVVVLAVAISANRIYPLWLGSAQLIAVSNHFLPLVAPDLRESAYLVVGIFPRYVQAVAMALGTVTHMRRLRKFGHYRCWRGSSILAANGDLRPSPAA